MTEYFKKCDNSNTVLGFLSPEGEFSYCHSFEHLSMSEDICKEKGYYPYDKSFSKTNCIEKERYLHDLGYAYKSFYWVYKRNSVQTFKT